MELLRPPLLQRLTARHWTVVDCTAALLAMGLVTLLWQGADHRGGPVTGDLVTVLLAVLAVALRRGAPGPVLALVPPVAAAATFVRGGPVPLVAAAFAVYTVPQRLPRREALVLLAATLAVMATAAGVTGFLNLPYGPPARHSDALLVESALTVTAAWAVGFAVQQQRLYAAGLRAQAEQRIREHLAEARRAAGEERLRIARELHDVVAHSMGVIAVQAGVAHHVAAERPEEARQALSSIEETSRGALREMRAMLGILRGGTDGTSAGRAGAGADLTAGLAPAPGLADLGDLVERAADAGVRVELEVTGEARELSPGVELAAYRVVQEAVTNVVRHASVDRCRVCVVHRADGLALEVTDDGAGQLRDGAGPADAGHGITGMRERVGMYGGEFRAGPRPGGGFQVSALFPVAHRKGAR
ncbi:sensor histidine kinase [Kitasatospora cinereorecta]|uniref:histidine kinase n=1 Tax=Kitasatospora cinereorecta TaxID=285560 RepID=A0ABW0VCN6_9ACTN